MITHYVMFYINDNNARLGRRHDAVISYLDVPSTACYLVENSRVNCD